MAGLLNSSSIVRLMTSGITDARQQPASAAGAFGRTLAGGAGIGAVAGMLTATVFLGGAMIQQNPPGQRLGVFAALPLFLLIGLPIGVVCGLVGSLFSGMLVAGIAPWWRSPAGPARLAGAVIYAAPLLITSLIGTAAAPHLGVLWPHPAITLPALVGAAAGGLWLGPWLLPGAEPVKAVTRRGLMWSAAVMVAVLSSTAAVVGFTGWGPGQQVEVVAGAGTGAGDSAQDTAVVGRLIGMTPGGDGSLRLLTAQGLEYTLWTIRAQRIGRVPVRGLTEVEVAQVAAGPGGAMYAALRQGPGSVVRIEPDGGTVRVLGVDRATYQGPTVPVPDGSAAGGAYLGALEGAAMAADGGWFFAENRFSGHAYQVVRAVRDSRLVTVLGRQPQGSAREASVANGFPNGIRGSELTIDSGYVTPLAVAADGTLYAAVGARGVVRVGASGAVDSVIGALNGAGKEVTSPQAPWRDRGAAAGAEVSLAGSVEGVSMVTDRDGDLYLTSQRGTGDRLPESFAWDGIDDEGQRAVVDQARKDRWADTETEVLRIGADGRLATVAGQADLIAIDDGWLYLAQTFHAADNTERVLVVRTPIQ